MLTCRELTEFLDDYIADAVPGDRRAVFEGHLAACVDCRNYLASYRETVRLVKGVGEGVAEGVPPALVAAVLAARAREGGRKA